MSKSEINRRSGAVQKRLERNWAEIERAMDYLVKTSRKDMGWREALGRPYENRH